MKKSKHLLLLLLGVITLSGCGNKPSSSSTPPDSSTPVTSESTPPASSSESTPPDSSSESTPPVSSSETSTSEVEPPLEMFTVTWKDEKGNLLGTTRVEENSLPSYSYVPTSDEKATKVFVGWSLTLGGEVVSLSPVTGEVTYFAVITETPKEYTITFNVGAGSSVPSITVPYGSEVAVPESPKLDGHRFVGWSFDLAGNNKVSWPFTVTGHVTFYAQYNESIDLKGYLASLTTGYKLNPYDYIPEAMRPDYAPNVVKESDLVLDYTSFVNKSSIKTGYGEQWNMVLDNLNQSMLFFNALTAVEAVVASSVTVFNNYLDNNPGDFAEHEFTHMGNYRVVILFNNDVLTYVLTYTLAGVTTEIALSLNIITGERVGRIQLGDANALRYVIHEDSYTFAIRYLGVRRAFFQIKRVGDDIGGHIYETLGLDNVFTTVSASQFFVIDDYLAVVGNKASRNLGSSNTVSELYNKNSGKLLGYEIEEKYPLVTYHSLWFNLSGVSGINNIKIAKNAEEVTQVFLNNQTTPFAIKTLGGLNPLTMTSKRYNIEARDQYFSVFNAETESYVTRLVETPMIFVQEHLLNSFVSDVKEKNSYLTSFALILPSKDVTNIIAHYKALVPNFKEFKEQMTIEDILTYIGTPILG